MNLFTDHQDKGRWIYDALCKERDAIVKQGGDRVPDSVIQECMDLRHHRQASMDQLWLKKEIILRFELYRQSIPTVQAERRAKLKTAALKSSRLTRLRQRRGLPFKSRRQP